VPRLVFAMVCRTVGAMAFLPASLESQEVNNLKTHLRTTIDTLPKKGASQR
jgi:hypothetical protein